MKFSLLPLAAACAISAGATAAPQAPGASTALTVDPREFQDACHADMARARAGMEKLKGLKANAAATLDTFDSAQWVLGAAGARAGLAHEVHPDAALREAAETCDQETSALFTEFSLDRAIYDALARIDPASLDAGGRHYCAPTRRTLPCWTRCSRSAARRPACSGSRTGPTP